MLIACVLLSVARLPDGPGWTRVHTQSICTYEYGDCQCNQAVWQEFRHPTWSKNDAHSPTALERFAEVQNGATR